VISLEGARELEKEIQRKTHELNDAMHRAVALGGLEVNVHVRENQRMGHPTVTTLSVDVRVAPLWVAKDETRNDERLKSFAARST